MKRQESDVRLFLRTRRSDATRELYRRTLRLILSGRPDAFLKLARKRPVEAERQLMRFLMKKRKTASSTTISSYLYCVKSFLEFNGVSLRWKRIKQTIPNLKRLTTDRAPTRKEIRKLLAHSDSRLKAAALMMASGGLRVGAFWYPKVGGGYGFMRVRDVSFRENGIAAVRTYSGEPEEATALVSAEAVAALKRYWRTRKREGERMGPYSPVLAVDKKRVVPDSFRKDRRRYPEHPSGLKAALTVDGIQSAFAKAWKASGVLPEGRSPEFRSCHGLRKRWETEAKRSVGTKIGTWRGADDRIAAEDIEALLGHRSSYHRPSLERLEAVYLSLQPFLTISPGRGRPPIQNHDLGDSNSAILTLKREFRRQGQELAALDQKIDGLVSMVERLVITTRPSYGAVESDMPA